MASKDKAPGGHRRHGISFIELADMFPDEATATRWFEAQLGARTTGAAAAHAAVG